MARRILDFMKGFGIANSVLLLGYLLNFLHLGYIFGYLLFVALLLKNKFVKNNLDFNLFLLGLFCVIYAVFYSLDPGKGMQYVFIYSLIPPTLYLWGKHITHSARDSQQLFEVLLAIGIVLSIAALISVLLNIQQGGFVQGSRSVPFFWTSKLTNATGMAAPFLLNMCIPAILLASHKKMSILTKIGLAVIFGLTLMCVLRLGSRTQLVIAMFTFLATLIYVLPKQTWHQNMGLFAILVLCVFMVYRNVSFDWDADWLTSFAGRMDNNGSNDIASGGGRTQRWVKSLENIVDKPLGWDLEDFGYSHNLWFDVLRLGTVICFFLLIVYTIRSMIQVRRTLSVNPSDTAFNVLAAVYFLAFMLLFMVEPIIDGSFYIFAVFCMFMGVINKYNSSFKT